MLNKKILTFVNLWVPVGIWCGLIFFFSSIPDLKIESLGSWDLILRKIAHFSEYAILTLLLFRGFISSTQDKTLDFSIFFWPVFLSILYAFTDEFHQFFIPGRFCSLIDVLIDSSGAVFMFLLLYKKNRLLKKFFKAVIPQFALLLFILNLCGCTIQHKFKKAQELEKKGYYMQAIEQYLKISKQHPADKLAPESLYKAACLYHRKINIPSKANDLLYELIKTYSNNDYWVHTAKRSIFNLNNYFPLADGNKWIEGDSQSKGKNMNAVSNCINISSDIYKITKDYYAGSNFAMKTNKFYRKFNLELHESNTPDFKEYTALLKYPFAKGLSWLAEQDNKKTKFTIIDTEAEIKLVSGVFNKCLKVKEQELGLSQACKYKYYVLDLGCVLTTVGTDRSEYNYTELLSSKLASPDEQQ